MKSMNISRKVLFVLFTSLSLFILSGCGYKPSAYYAKKELSGKVFVKLNVDLIDPGNAVLIKDAMNKLLIQKLDSKLVYKEELADTVMFLKIDSVKMEVLQYDADGYNKLYRALVTILVKYTKKETGITKSFTVDGEDNFSVDSSDENNDTITDSIRFDAIQKNLNAIIRNFVLFTLKLSSAPLVLVNKIRSYLFSLTGSEISFVSAPRKKNSSSYSFAIVTVLVSLSIFR